ncbi:MAG: DUF4340 domain-containing protein [Candidatus Omnitrophica bacterium]|nr:DUF4340 domain-containing protein [Candidatus Omnitrophota bacterium]
MKIFSKTLSLLILLILICVFYFYEIKYSAKREKKEEGSKKVFIVEKNEIKSIIINNEDKKIELVSLNNQWFVKDKNYECDKNEIESLLNKIISLQINRNLGEIEDLTQYGLTDSKKFIEIKYNGTKQTLFIGGQTPSGSYLYTTKDKKNVYLVYKWDLNDIIEKDMFDLVDKRILPVEIKKSDIEQIEIKNKVYFLVRRKGDIWNFEKPINDWADKEKIDNFLDKIINGKIKSFEEDKKEKDCGLEKPKIIISLKTKDKEYFLHFGKKVNETYYCKNSLKPYIFLVEENLLEMPDEINALREKKLFDFNISDLIEFSIIKKGKELKIVKDGEKYYNESDKHKKISKEKVEEFLSDIKYLEIKDFISYSETNLKKYGLSSPLIRIIVKYNKTKTEIHFGTKTEKDIYCYHPERKIIFTIPSSDYSKIDKDFDFFIEKSNE